jgi:predicted NAD/FAD-binding protein
MASAIWSAPKKQILDYPAASFIRFHDNHGLLRLRNRPPWRTVTGGSRAYVEPLTRSYKDRIRLGAGVTAVHRSDDGVKIRDHSGTVETFDDVVIACHADQALAMLDVPTPEERQLLGAFRYSDNLAVLHSDPALMPKRRAVWSSWNHIGTEREDNDCPTVTYWMNSLQNIPDETPLFVTLNPPHAPRHEHYRDTYAHPLFDATAIAAQARLWSLQGRRNTWFCGAYFGAGFHEDGLQSGLAVAEALGGVRRPWAVPNESGRIFIEQKRPAVEPSGVAA